MLNFDFNKLNPLHYELCPVYVYCFLDLLKPHYSMFCADVATVEMTTAGGPGGFTPAKANVFIKNVFEQTEPLPIHSS